jgi:putative alpha-1,2-mannosidase
MGSPLVKEGIIQLENGRSFTIEALGQSDKNIFIKSVVLNGKTLTRRYVTHVEIMEGGTLAFQMSSKPNKAL